MTKFHLIWMMKQEAPWAKNESFYFEKILRVLKFLEVQSVLHKILNS